MKIKRLFCFILTFLMISSSVQIYATENELDVTYEATYDVILNNTKLFYIGKSFYYDCGKKMDLTLNDLHYVPMESNECMYMPVMLMKELFKLNAEWDAESEVLTLYNDDYKNSIRIGEDAIYINDVGRYITNYAKKTEDTILLPLQETASSFGYVCKIVDDLYIISNDEKTNEVVENIDIKTIVAITDLFETYVFTENFDDGKTKMYFGSWDGEKRGNGITIDKETNDNCAYMNCPSKGFEGYQSMKVLRGDRFKRNAPTYKVSFSYKVNEDFDAKLTVTPFMYYEGKFVRIHDLQKLNVKEKGKWVRTSVYLDNDNMPLQSRDYNSDSFDILIRVDNAKNNKSTVWIDDVRISAYNSGEEVLDAHMVADKFAAWYQLGDTITYKPNYPEILKSTNRIKATVYDCYGDEYYTETVETEKIIEEGWVYTPTENGWYDVEFTGFLADGRELPIVIGRSFTSEQGTKIGYYYLERTEFFVTKSGTKAKEDRNESIYFSIDSVDTLYGDDYAHLAELVGFHGNRWISLDWGDRPSALGGSDKGVESVKGVFNWTKPDKYFELMEKYGFEDKIVCLMTTPRWATVPDEQITDAQGNRISPTSTTLIGNYVYNNYLAYDIRDWTNFIEKTTERYKGKVKIWEIWNEPMMGKSAFWYDTPESYVKMLESAYDTIKNVDPNVEVSTAGMGNNTKYTLFLEEMLKIDPNILDKMDYYAAHGTYDSISVIKQIIEKSGHEPIPWINTEGYYGPIPPTETRNMQASKCILAYLMQYKMGASITTFFTIANTRYELEDIKRRGTEQDYAIFRYFPYITPKKSGAALHTLFELMDKDFAIKTEYEFDNGLKGVLCKSGEKHFLTVWHPSCKDSTIPTELYECLNVDGSVMRLDGKVVNNLIVPAEQIVYLTDINVEKLSQFEAKTDTALNTKYTGTHFKCLTPEAAEQAEIDSAIKMKMAKQPLFNIDSLNTINESEIEWVETDYEWVANSGNTPCPTGFTAKHAAYIDEQGLYIMVDVNDTTDAVNGTSEKNIWSMDGVQFAFKANSETSQNMHEFSVGLVNGEPVVYKEINASVLSDQPPTGYTKTGIVESAKVSIIKEGNKVHYKIFIPSEQLWPYFFDKDSKYMRLSICVNNNDGEQRIGWLQWSSGIASGKNSSLFGYLMFE